MLRLIRESESERAATHTSSLSSRFTRLSVLRRAIAAAPISEVGALASGEFKAPMGVVGIVSGASTIGTVISSSVDDNDQDNIYPSVFFYFHVVLMLVLLQLEAMIAVQLLELVYVQVGRVPVQVGHVSEY